MADETALGATSNNGLQLIKVPDEGSLESFKAHVRSWMSLDNEIKRLEAVLRERKKLKQELSEKVLDFMSNYNIEDLNTRDGRLRYRVSSVMAPLTQKMIRERVADFLSAKLGAVDGAEIDGLFGRERVDKVSLKRLK